MGFALFHECFLDCNIQPPLLDELLQLSLNPSTVVRKGSVFISQGLFEMVPRTQLSILDKEELQVCDQRNVNLGLNVYVF